MFRRKGGPLPLGHKPAGRQTVRFADPGVTSGPTKNQSVLGTLSSFVPGVFSSASGGAGFRTFDGAIPGRSVQPSTLGFFAPFAVSESRERTRGPGAFGNPKPSDILPAPKPAPVVRPSAVREEKRHPARTPAVSTVFPVPR